MRCGRDECIWRCDLGLCRNDKVELDCEAQCCTVLTFRELYENAKDGEWIPDIFDREACIEAGPDRPETDEIIKGIDHILRRKKT